MRIISNLLLAFAVIVVGCAESHKDNSHLNENTDLSFIRNGTVGHKIVWSSCDTCVPIITLGARVVTDLKDGRRALLKRVTSKEWIQLLYDDNSDFCANILLYEMYERDAEVLRYYNSREEWRKYLKDDDIDFWKINLR